jgi:hypothetical protein
MKWISSRRETIPLTEKELVIIKEKETSGSERRWRTGEVVAASPNSMLSPSLCHSVASVKKLYERMKDLESWPSGYGNEKWCVCVFWRAEDSVLGLFYRQLLYSNMPALLNCRPLFPTRFLMPIIALTFLLYHGRKPGGWTSEKTVMGLVKLGDFLLFLELLLGVRQRWV